MQAIVGNQLRQKQQKCLRHSKQSLDFLKMHSESHLILCYIYRLTKKIISVWYKIILLRVYFTEITVNDPDFHMLPTKKTHEMCNKNITCISFIKKFKIENK